MVRATDPSGVRNTLLPLPKRLTSVSKERLNTELAQPDTHILKTQSCEGGFCSLLCIRRRHGSDLSMSHHTVNGWEQLGIVLADLRSESSLDVDG